jgi:hypothetical protein
MDKLLESDVIVAATAKPVAKGKAARWTKSQPGATGDAYRRGPTVALGVPSH